MKTFTQKGTSEKCCPYSKIKRLTITYHFFYFHHYPFVFFCPCQHWDCYCNIHSRAIQIISIKKAKLNILNCYAIPVFHNPKEKIIKQNQHKRNIKCKSVQNKTIQTSYYTQ